MAGMDVFRFLRSCAAFVNTFRGRCVTFEATFDDHKTITEDIPITRHNGYLLNAIAELHAEGFDISPSGPQSRELQTGNEERWLWSDSAF